ncbi:MAG: DNA gyrase inhibitor YacG [Planctomycetota bacterium]|nr:DNA gyrase inhibitor YacG [Planctomycetota bacterium]
MVRATTCGICNNVLPIDAAKTLRTFPFCSERCQQIDLHRWMDGRYAIVEDADPEELLEQLHEEDEFDE